MTEHDPHSGSREAEDEMRQALEDAEPAADDMERRSEALEEEIEKVEGDWESKQQDDRVPGAQEDIEEVETERQDLGEEPAGDEG